MNEYKVGDIIGSFGVVFIREIEPKIYKNKYGYIKKVRQGIFTCPICGEDFDATFNNVRQGRTRSCGKHDKAFCRKCNNYAVYGWYCDDCMPEKVKRKRERFIEKKKKREKKRNAKVWRKYKEKKEREQKKQLINTISEDEKVIVID